MINHGCGAGLQVAQCDFDVGLVRFEQGSSPTARLLDLCTEGLFPSRIQFENHC